MATLRDYSPNSVAMSWGNINFVGFAEDTFVTVSRNSPNTSMSVGADGSVGLTKMADRTGTIEITLMQTSETHRYLGGIQNLQDFGERLFRANMTITDPSGGFICKALNVHLMEPPEVSLGSDQNEKTWTFYAEQLIFTDAPAGFTRVAGEISRIDDAISGITEISDQLLDAIRG